MGILVDDATVTIENINAHLEQGKEVGTAILDGAQQIALPALVSTLSICIVFVPMFLLAGIAQYLFIPMAEAVVFAMLASYLLSRTLVPTLAKYLVEEAAEPRTQAADARGIVRPISERASSGDSSAFATGYRELLELCAAKARPFASDLPGVIAATALLAFPLGPLPGWARISSRPSMAARSSCICARAPARASRRPRAVRPDRGSRSAPAIPANGSAASSTTSACLTAASISLTAPRRRSAPRTRTYSSTLQGGHRPTAE